MEKILKRYSQGRKITETGNYIRLRLIPPSRFKKGSFRTHDVGRSGFTKRISGRLKRNDKWETQAWIFNKKDFGRKKAILGARKMIED